MSEFALRVAVAVLVAVVILVIVYVMWQGASVLLEAFAGVLFGIFLTTLSSGVRKVTGVRHAFALAVVLVALLVVAAGLGWLLESRVLAETAELTRKLPEAIKQLRALIASTPGGEYLMEQLPGAASQATPGMFARVTGLVWGVADFLIAVLVIFFVGLFAAANPDLYRAGLLHLVPQAYRERAVQTLDAITSNLRWWLARFC